MVSIKKVCQTRNSQKLVPFEGTVKLGIRELFMVRKKSTFARLFTIYMTGDVCAFWDT